MGKREIKENKYPCPLLDKDRLESPTIKWRKQKLFIRPPYKSLYDTGVKQKAHGLNLALYLVLSGLALCFYPVVAPSSCLTIKE